MFTSITSKFMPVIAVLCLVLCTTGAGCLGAPAASSSSSSADSRVGIVSLEFGDKTIGAVAVRLSNKTGFDITGLNIVPNETGGDPHALMEPDDSIPSGRMAVIYVEPVGGERFLVSFVCNGVQYQLHDVDLVHLGSASVCLEGDVAYLEMTVGNNVVNTLAQEQGILHPTADSPAPVEAADEEYYEEYYYEEDESEPEEGADHPDGEEEGAPEE